jgi:pimeloyl-ACP methyl ester carboxylesterase
MDGKNRESGHFLTDEYTVYGVLRSPDFPEDYTPGAMARDYAEVIAGELGGPVDLVGLSTGGSIVQEFAADHPELVRRLVLHSSGYRLNDKARRVQLRVADLAAGVDIRPVDQHPVGHLRNQTVFVHVGLMGPDDAQDHGVQLLQKLFVTGVEVVLPHRRNPPHGVVRDGSVELSRCRSHPA